MTCHQAPATARRTTISRAIALLLLAGNIACDLPRDPNGTLKRVRGGTMRVGVVEHRPWTTLTPDGGAGGLEGALVAELARELGARITWVRSTESQLLEALRMRELDVVIGGMTDDTPWKAYVALTKPFYTDTIVVGAPLVVPGLRDVHGKMVAVSVTEPAVAGYVRKKGGVPVPVPDPAYAVGLVAVPTWRLPLLGFTPVGIVLHESHHVIATPPGENAWLVRVERTIDQRKAVIPGILRMSRP